MLGGLMYIQYHTKHKIKMKLRTLINSKTALELLLKGSLPISIAWDLKKFVKVVNPEFTSYAEIREQKIIEMGEKKKNDKGKEEYKVKEKNMPAFLKLMNELLDKDIDIIIPQINIKDLMEYKDVNGKGIDMTTGDLMLLEWLIVEE